MDGPAKSGGITSWKRWVFTSHYLQAFNHPKLAQDFSGPSTVSKMNPETLQMMRVYFSLLYHSKTSHPSCVSENGIPPIPSWIIAIFPLDMMILRYTPFSDKPKWLEKSWEIPIFPNMFYPKPHGSLCFMVYIICRSTHIIFSCKFHCIFMIPLGPQVRPPGKMLEKNPGEFVLSP